MWGIFNLVDVGPILPEMPACTTAEKLSQPESLFDQLVMAKFLDTTGLDYMFTV